MPLHNAPFHEASPKYDLSLSALVSNGRYRSVVHRAVLNNRDARISVVVANGPELVEKEEALLKCTTYSYYFQIQQQSRLPNALWRGMVGDGEASIEYKGGSFLYLSVGKVHVGRNVLIVWGLMESIDNKSASDFAIRGHEVLSWHLC
ncbi:flavanone 3-dioxygenase 2-like [Senna tora]|uniref:Flavanone 3-dioxygenase 2-like n=1 Tax=Senna tora TaxID=362788 RepID=A0A834TSU4_9FABA|nr:flavanone 3-dioxygenase 2-like [Senna tora]